MLHGISETLIPYRDCRFSDDATDFLHRLELALENRDPVQITQRHGHLTGLPVDIHFAKELKTRKRRGVLRRGAFWNTSSGPKVLSSTLGP